MLELALQKRSLVRQFRLKTLHMFLIEYITSILFLNILKLVNILSFLYFEPKNIPTLFVHSSDFEH